MGIYIELGKLRLAAGITYNTILDVSITTAKNSYAAAKICVEAEASEAKRLETGENPTKVTLTTTDGATLFSGACASYGLNQTGGYCTIEILAYGNGCLLDKEKKTRNFQQPGSLDALALEVMSGYGGMISVNKQIELKGIESQQNETDWEFLLRLAGREGLNLYENGVSAVPHLVIGGDGFKSVDEIPDEVETGVNRNIAEYELIQRNVEPEAAAYQYDSRSCKSSGAELMAGYTSGKEMITATNIVTKGGVLVNHLELSNVKSERAGYQTSSKSAAVKTAILTGEVIGVEGTNVQVQFETEDSQDTAMAVWMPYECTMNNYFYCMPDIGDKVYCYYEDGGNGVCLGSLRTNLDNPDLQDSSAKMLTTQDDMIRFIGNALEFLTNRSMVEQGSSIMSHVMLDNESGISIHSNGDVVFDATEGDGKIELTATAKAGDGMLEMYAVAAIKLSVADSSISIAGDRIDIKSPVFYWEGTTKQSGYEHKEDEMQDWFSVGLDALQFGLDIIGMLPIPGVSLAADLINAGISAARGDWFGCAMSLVGAIPVAGSLASAGKLGKNALNAAQTVTKVASKAGDIVSGAAKAANMTKQLSKLSDMGKALVKTVKFVMNAVDIGQAVITDVQLVVLMAQGEFDPLNDADDAALLIQSMRGNLSLYKHGKEAAVKKKQAGKTAVPEGNTQTAKKTTQGDTSTERKCINDPVDVITGSMSIQHTDMNIHYAGGEFELVRSYESVHKNPGCMLGSYWFTNFDECISKEGNVYTVMLSGMHLEKFKLTDTGFVNLRNEDPSVQLRKAQGGYCYRDNKNQTERYFAEDGKLLAYYDRNKDGFALEYRGNLLAEAVFTGGAKLTFLWENNKLSSVTDIIGRSVSYRYEQEFLKEVVCVDGGIIRYDYTKEGRLHQICDQNGKNYVTNEYDRRGRVVRQVLSNGEEFVTFYDDAKKENTFLTVSTGERIVYTYDVRKLPLKELYADGTYIEKAYDQWENVIYERDRKGNEIRREYNEQGKCIREEFPDGYVITTSYDTMGNPREITDNAGAVTRFEYDKKGNLLLESRKIDEERWQKFTYTRDAHGRVVSGVDANGNADNYVYEEHFKEPVRYCSREGSVFHYSYDKAGRLMEERNDAGIRHYGYDNYDRVVIAADEEDNTTKRTFDSLGNLLTTTYPKSYADRKKDPDIRMFYDDFEHPIRIKDAEGGVQDMKRDAQGRIVEETGQIPGEVVRYEYEEFEEPVRIRYPDGGVERRFYDVKGNIIKRVLPEQYDSKTDDGAGTTYEYDNRERLICVMTSEGKVQWKGEYDYHGNLIRVETAGGGEKRYRYNLLDWLIEERELLSRSETEECWSLVRYEYNYNGNRIGELRYTENQTLDSARGRILHLKFFYDKENRLIRKEDGHGASEAYEYDAVGRQVRSIQYFHEQKKLITEYTYSPAGRILEKSLFDAAGVLLAKSRYIYDANGNVTKAVTPLGHEIRKSYDRMNRVVEEIHEGRDGMIHNTRTYSYDRNGNLTAVTIADGTVSKTTRFAMDANGRMAEVIYPDGSHKNVFYDKNGWLTGLLTPQLQKAAQGKGYAYSYDMQGRCQAVTGPEGNVLEQYHYDESGQLAGAYDAKGNGITYQYDLAGRRILASTTGGSSQKWAYNPWGQVNELTDGNGNVTGFELDAWGRVVTVNKADGSKEQYTYDPAGKMLTSEDGEGNISSYQYDSRGNMTGRVDALGNADTFTYDAENYLSSHVNRNGICTKYSYTMYGNLTERYVTAESAAQAGVEPLRESFGYTGDGLLSYAIGGGMRYDYSYDLMGRVIDKSASGKTLLSYTYDADGKVLTRTDITGKTTEYRYDLTGNLTEVYDDGTRQALYEYDEAGRKTRQTIGNGLVSEYAYNADGILRSLKTSLSGGVTGSQEASGMLSAMGNISANGNTGIQLLAENYYSYDGNGNVICKDTLNGSSMYGYDVQNRLTSVSSSMGEERFSYDNAGNRIERRLKTAQENLVEKYRYNAGNRLMSVERLRGEMEEPQFGEANLGEGMGTAQTHGNSQTLGIANVPQIESFTYDKQGNMLSDGSFTYRYDSFNRLAVAEAEGACQVNRYDAEGLRHELEENWELV